MRYSPFCGHLLGAEEVLTSSGLIACGRVMSVSLVTPWVSWKPWSLCVITVLPAHRAGKVWRESPGLPLVAGGHREICSSGFPETVIQAVTSKVSMGILVWFQLLAWLTRERNSKPPCTASRKHRQQVQKGTLVRASLGHMAVNFLVELLTSFL